MNDLMKNIFKELDFIYMENWLDEPDISFNISYKDDNKKEYFISVFTNDLESVKTVQKKIHSNLKKKWEEIGMDSDWEKNTTMIIFYNLASQDGKQINSKILDLEEDPYFFKKQVLAYTDFQVNEFNVKKGDLSYIEFLNSYVNDIDKHKFFKKENKNLNENLYAFVSNLYIKLPFLSLPVIAQDKSDVVADFHDSLNDKEKKIYDFLMELETVNSDSYKDMEKLV